MGWLITHCHLWRNDGNSTSIAIIALEISIRTAIPAVTISQKNCLMSGSILAKGPQSGAILNAKAPRFPELSLPGWFHATWLEILRKKLLLEDTSAL
jgi:hypothetical protein